MNKINKNKIIPKLRFPEFRNNGEWEEKKISDLIKIITPPKKLPTVEYFKKGAFPIIDQSQNLICGWTDDEKALITENLPLIIFGDHTCIVKFVNKPFAQGADGIKIFNTIKEIKANYLFHYLKFNPVIQEEYKRHFSILKEKVISYPQNQHEQQKIADCLSSLDDLIESQMQKLENLKTHKKGLLQQLFPAEGEKVPNIRFPEFKKKGEWEEKKLGDICIINPTTEKLPKSFIYIDLESVESGVLLKKKLINLENAPSRAQRLLKLGDIIFQMVRPYQKNNFIFLSGDSFNYVASTGYAQIRTNQINTYLYQYFQNQIFVDIVLSKCSGSNYPAININDLSEIIINIPCLSEQQKIADCLSSLDELIEFQIKKIENLKQHKRGLMQQLFPITN